MKRLWKHRGLMTIILLLLIVTIGQGHAWGKGTPPPPARLAGAFVTHPATAWREVWNAEGTLYAAASPPEAQDRILWAVGDDGRLMRTEDGGRFWRFSRLPDRPTLRDLVLLDSLHGWAVGEDAAVL